MRDIYRYEFSEVIDIGAVESSLFMAILGTEALHGESQVRLDAGYAFDAQQRSCVIDASTDVGRDINRLFTGFLRQEFDADQFQVKRLDAPAAGELADTAAK